MWKNHLSARKTTPNWLTFNIQQTKNIVRITCEMYFNARASHDEDRGDTKDSLLRWNTPFRTWYEIYYFQNIYVQCPSSIQSLTKYTLLFNLLRQKIIISFWIIYKIIFFVRLYRKFVFCAPKDVRKMANSWWP